MRAARYVFGAELRQGGWRFVAGTALLLGLVGGGALLAASGARRTASAFERLERQTLAGTVLVNPNSEGAVKAVTTDRLRSIDGVAAVSHGGGIIAFVNGNLNMAVAYLQGSGPEWFTEVDRPVVREGRLPDQSRPEELFTNPTGAKALGLKVGDAVDLLTVSADEMPSQQGSLDQLLSLIDSGAIGHHIRARLVGIGVTTGDVVPGAALDSILLTRAFHDSTKTTEIFGGDAVRQRAGASVDQFNKRVRALAPDDASIDFQRLSSDRDTVRRAVTPQVVGLIALAIALALGALLSSAQSLGRRAAIRSDNDLALSASGMTSRERRSVDWLRLLFVTASGTVVAIVIAGLASPLTPVGVARDVEPARGVSLDWVVLGLGGLGLGLCVAALGAIATLRARGASERAARPSQVAAWLRSRTANAPLAVGVGLGLEPGHGRTSVPTRSTIVAACTGLLAIVASLTFAASLDHLVSSPPSYGVGFDAVTDVPDEDTSDLQIRLEKAIAEAPEVEGATQLYLEQVQLPRGIVSAYGFQVSKGAGPVPTLVRGRLPVGLHEIALGATTLRRESLDVGDQVRVSHGSDKTASSFTIVGQVVLPGIAQYSASDQAALGEGALFSLDGYSALTGIQLYSSGAGDKATTPINTLLDLRTGATRAELARRLDERIGMGIVVVNAPTKSSDITSLERVRSTPLVLAALLGLLAAVTVAHALVVSVRRRRLDLAVLRSMGFTPGQVSRAVGWQATTVAGIAAAVGIPLGIVVGRIAWSAVARQLGVVNEPIIPLAALAALPAAVIFANLVAVVPGWRAARLRPAEILRSE